MINEYYFACKRDTWDLLENNTEMGIMGTGAGGVDTMRLSGQCSLLKLGDTHRERFFYSASTCVRIFYIDQASTHPGLTP